MTSPICYKDLNLEFCVVCWVFDFLNFMNINFLEKGNKSEDKKRKYFKEIQKKIKLNFIKCYENGLILFCRRVKSPPKSTNLNVHYFELLNLPHQIYLS